MSLARLLTLIVAAACVLDGWTRALPRDLFTFRAWEAVTWNAPANAPFRPNYRFDRPHTYGDLVNLGNLPQYRQYHREVFSTDDWGFRRNPTNDGVTGPMRMLVAGDSFAAGSGLSDHETLAARLANALGTQVYNTAPFALGPAGVDALRQRLNMKGGWLLYQQYGRNAPDVTKAMVSPVPSAHGALPWTTWLRQRLFANPAPLRIMANGVARRLQNDRLLANPQQIVVASHLTNGDTMLSMPAFEEEWTVTRAPLPPPVTAQIAKDAATYRWWRDEMAKRNLTLVVLIVPDKFSVYGSFMQDGPAEFDYPNAYVDGMVAELRAANIHAIDLTRTYIEQARLGLARRQYLYRLDDTHWSPLGVDLAARQIAQILAAKGVLAGR